MLWFYLKHSERKLVFYEMKLQNGRWRSIVNISQQTRPINETINQIKVELTIPTSKMFVVVSFQPGIAGAYVFHDRVFSQFTFYFSFVSYFNIPQLVNVTVNVFRCPFHLCI